MSLVARLEERTSRKRTGAERSLRRIVSIEKRFSETLSYPYALPVDDGCGTNCPPRMLIRPRPADADEIGSATGFDRFRSDGKSEP